MAAINTANGGDYGGTEVCYTNEGKHQEAG